MVVVALLKLTRPVKPSFKSVILVKLGLIPLCVPSEASCHKHRYPIGLVTYLRSTSPLGVRH